jgi:putative phosphoribosyl transferase
MQGRTAIIVDDGIATGATVRAAIHALRRQGPRRIVIATPLASPDTLERLGEEADEVICLQAPEQFSAIGSYYRDFSQVGDDEVAVMLEKLDAEGVPPDKAAASR